MLSIRKKLRFSKDAFIGSGLAIMALTLACNQSTEDPVYRQKMAAERMAINESFFNPKETPLDSAHFVGFKGIKFYPIQEQYKVKARVSLLQNQPVFELPHSHGKTKPYKNYAILSFELNGKSLELMVLEQLTKKPGAENYLLLPFTDESNGQETYGAGRYIDLDKTNQASEIEIDFNSAYNPYCAYSADYTCPIPPKENHIPFKVEAGMKNLD